nr:hypothetical protein [Tanacetum cinerariifolium]
MTDATIKQLIAQDIADAMANYEANRSSRNGDDSYDSRSGRRRTEHTTQAVEMAMIAMTREVAEEGQSTLLVNAREIKKLKIEMWNLKVKGTEVVSYTLCFQELSLMSERMFLEKSDQVEKYVVGLPDMIQGSVMASKPKTTQEKNEIANDLMDQKVHAYAERQARNKRKLDNNNQAQQQPLKKQNMARAYYAGPSERKEGDCPKLKNQNYENQAGGTEACGVVYALGGGETDQDLDNIKDNTNA